MDLEYCSKPNILEELTIVVSEWAKRLPGRIKDTATQSKIRNLGLQYLRCNWFWKRLRASGETNRRLCHRCTSACRTGENSNRITSSRNRENQGRSFCISLPMEASEHTGTKSGKVMFVQQSAVLIPCYRRYCTT